MSTHEECMVSVSAFLRDAGTVLVFKGWDNDNQRWVAFGCDHRPGRDLLDALEAWILEGRLDGEEPVASVPEWAVLT